MTKRICANLLPHPFLVLGAVFLFAGCAVDGAALFEREGCRNCHRFRGPGGNLAPDLTAVTNVRSDTWIKRQIRNPSANDSQTRMPAFGHLSRGEVRALLAFLKG
jgi:mono/diheme cytochrome c family protein